MEGKGINAAFTSCLEVLRGHSQDLKAKKKVAFNSKVEAERRKEGCNKACGVTLLKGVKIHTSLDQISCWHLRESCMPGDFESELGFLCKGSEDPGKLGDPFSYCICWD